MKVAIVCFKYGVHIEDPCCYPMGFMYISAVLKQAGNDVTVFNLNLSDEMPNVINFDVVVMTGFEEFLPHIKTLAAECKIKGIKTVLGGALATFRPHEMLKHVDTVIIGEGEDVINQALHSFGIVQGTKPNLDTLPLPDYEGFGIDEYHRRHSLRYMGVLTSRGCPFSCKFCTHTCHFQYRDLGKVFEEIDLYREKYQISAIVFNDNTLNVSKPRFLQICAEMGARKLAWTAAIRVDRFDEEMAAAAKNGGAHYFVVGVESFKQDKLDGMNKKITVEQICRTLDMLHKYDIGYHGNVLVGLPGETYRDILAEVREIPKQYRIFPALVQPFVGTEYKERSLTTEEETKLSQMFRDYVYSNGMYQYPELEKAA